MKANADRTPLDAESGKRLAKELGLLDREYAHIETSLGRVPTRTELAVFAGMWSEHCSYKSTKHLLKTLPTQGARVLAGPGSHAGAVEVGEGWAVAFKIESHNHPSAVEPYQGAATGVGGILRDVIAQGARPCAVMDSLCFGPPSDAASKRLRQGVVAGIAGYGNAIGIANVGGRTFYDPAFVGSPLVNALAAGMVRVGHMRTADAHGLGNALVYVGATTGRDGILGAAFASEELSDDSVEDRPHVQVGDPFCGKKVMEACLSFTPEMGLVAGQDMGAAGITCAAVEMAGKGGIGVEVDLETIPLREADMAPQEIMLSESQERFMFVVEKGREKAAVAHFESFGVHAVVCGHIVEGDRVRVRYQGELVVDVPAALVVDGCPPTNWPVAERAPEAVPYPDFAEPSGAAGLSAALNELLADPNIGSKAPLYSHYDQTVGNRTVRGPGRAEAPVLKLPDSTRGFSLTVENRPDWCAADARRGAMALVAAVMRNLACAGAELIAITDGINHGTPRDPVENKKLSEIIAGMGEALRTLGVACTGGNVSLYNEGKLGPIPPAPMIGGLGLVDDIRAIPGPAARQGDVLVLLGAPSGKPSTSRYGYLRSQAHRGVPSVDLAAEQRLAKVLLSQGRAGRLHAAKDVGAGGLAVTLVKLCAAAGLGATLSVPNLTGRADWWLFGEDAAVAVVACAASDADVILGAARDEGLPATRLGDVGGAALGLTVAGKTLLNISIDTIRAALGAEGSL